MFAPLSEMTKLKAEVKEEAVAEGEDKPVKKAKKAAKKAK